MVRSRSLPKYGDDLAGFIGILRQQVFSTQGKAAAHFHLHRTTIVRYEQGELTPPLGYLACLVQLLNDQLALAGEEVTVYQHTLLTEVNKAIRYDYRDIPFQDWAELRSVADEYWGQRQSFSSRLPPDHPVRADWGEAPDVSNFHGRQKELAELEQWILNDRCRLVGILGLGGIGKTTFAMKLTERVKGQFACLIWRSLRNAPPFADILSEYLHFLSDQPEHEEPNRIKQSISRLIEYLRQRPCLLVLDNAEAILCEGKQAGYYQPGYEAYGELLRWIGEASHQSCLLLTSREKPKEFAFLEGEASPVRSLQLTGLGYIDGREILGDKRLVGTDQAWISLTDRYSGNPLALKLVSETIREVFDGHIADFLNEETSIFGGIRDLLDQHFERLSALEQELIAWLAIEREPVSRESLQDNFVQFVSKRELIEALGSLRRRSLVEKHLSGFTLQNVVMEYATDCLIDQVCQEIMTQSLSILRSHALIKAQAKDYVRESQTRLILKLIATRLRAALGKEGVQDQLGKILATLHEVQPHESGYTAGNILNLLVQLKCDLSHFDLSHLTIRQAYLPGVVLHDVNFAGAELVNTVFTETFGGILSVTFSPDGQLLAAGTTKGEVRLWQAITGQPLLVFEGHTNWVQSVAFSPDNRLLASGSTDHKVRLWEASTGRCLQILSRDTNRIRSVAFSPDGRHLASGGADQIVHLWEVSTGRCLQTLSGHTDWILSVAFSPNGNILASGSKDQTIRLWDIATGECLATLSGHTDWIWSVAFSPTGQLLASGSDDQTVRLWEVTTGQSHHILQGHTDQVKVVSFSPDGHFLASGSNDRTVRLWDITRSPGQAWQTLVGHTGWVWALAFSSDSHTLASGSYNQTVRLWEVGTGRCLYTWRGYTNWVLSLSFNPNGQVLASGGDDGIARIWEISTGRCLQTLPTQMGWISSVAFSPDGRILATGSVDQAVRLWDVRASQYHRTLLGHLDWVWSVAFSFDSCILASSSEDQTIRLWDANTGQSLHTLLGHDSRIRSVAFSPGGEILASGSDDQTVRLWRVDTGQELHLLQGHTDWVMAVAFNPDSYLLASGSADQTVRLWDVNMAQCVKILKGHAGRVRSVAFSPVQELLASGSEDQTVQLWNIDTGQVVRTLSGHTDVVKSIAFSPDGTIIASTGDDGTIKLWDVQTGKCLRSLGSDRPYERMNITGVTRLTEAQKATLKALGAIEMEDTNEIITGNP